MNTKQRNYIQKYLFQENMTKIMTEMFLFI